MNWRSKSAQDAGAAWLPHGNGTVTHEDDGLQVTEWPPLEMKNLPPFRDGSFVDEPETNHPWDWGNAAIYTAQGCALFGALAAALGFLLGWIVGK
jgi:hypothetical protein